LNHITIIALISIILSFTLVHPDKIWGYIKALHDLAIKTPTTALISCGGLVVLISWMFYLIAGGAW